jgi:glycosyltransferase involved in cell wall biosynthesis/putative flippase GtrA
MNDLGDPPKLRICIVYDCLFPYTVGGAERWYRNLAERLAAEGHSVTYLTLRQWDRDQRGEAAGVDVVTVGPRCSLYNAAGARRIAPPLIFGLGVLWRLLRHGRSYDVVHASSFPFFSLLAIALLQPFFGYRIVVDWFEFWSKDYWRAYLGPLRGRIGWWVQALCARVPQQAFCLARLTADRLAVQGINGPITTLEGAYAGSLDTHEPRVAEATVVFAGRHIPEKRVGAVIPAVMRARERLPRLGACIFGTGPETPAVAAAARRVAETTGASPIEICGHAPSATVEDRLARALCMLLPSSREGYGLIVIEAAAKGVPSILVRGEDNAATALIEEGVNGFVAASASPDDLADAILRVHEAGYAMRASTADWFARNAKRLLLTSSLETVVAAYGAEDAADGAGAASWISAGGNAERLRYAAVSACCLLLHNVIVIGGAWLGLHYAAGMVVSFVVLVLTGYMAHATFTFRSGPSARSLAAYTLACLVNFPVALAVMFAFCTLLRLPVAIGAPATSIVMIAFNYVAARVSIAGRGVSLALPRWARN